MPFYEITHDFRSEAGWVLDRPSAGADYVMGNQDLQRFSQVSCRITSGTSQAEPLAIAHPNILVCSQALVDLLDIPGQTELIPVDIRHPDGSWLSGHFAVYVSQQVDGIDTDRSVFERWPDDSPIGVPKPGAFKRFDQLVIDETKVQGLSIFKLQNYSALTFVNGALRAQLMSCSIRGIAFRPL